MKRKRRCEDDFGGHLDVFREASDEREDVCAVKGAWGGEVREGEAVEDWVQEQGRGRRSVSKQHEA